CGGGGEWGGGAGGWGLGQELPAAAAVDVYSLTDLPRVLDRFGNRGYRAAQLEGGITGGRLYLAAYAQRFGATGLTFFDDEVIEFFSPHATGKSVMFLVALGPPDRATLGATTLPSHDGHGPRAAEVLVRVDGHPGTGEESWVLRARLVHPYDATLKDATLAKRRAWSQRVLHDLRKRLGARSRWPRVRVARWSGLRRPWARAGARTIPSEGA